MAYQKLQAGRAWSVNKSDNTDIPDIGTAGPTGTTTASSSFVVPLVYLVLPGIWRG